MAVNARYIAPGSTGIVAARQGRAGVVFGVRLIGLAAVAGAAALMVGDPVSRSRTAAAILAAALVGVAQLSVERRRLPALAWPLIFAQTCVWIALIHLTGGQRSPLAMGLVFEVPLAAGVLGRRGGLLAAAAGAVGFLAYATRIGPPAQPEPVGLVIGCLAVSGALTTLLVAVLERRDRTRTAAHATLAGRAEGLANEMQQLGDYMNDAWIEVDELGRVVSVNRAGMALLGDPANPPAGRAWQEVLSPDARASAELTRVLDEGRPLAGANLVFHRPDGTPVGARVEAWLTPTARGSCMHLLLAGPSGAASGNDPLRRLGEASACVAHQIRNSLQALQGLAHRAGQGASPAGPAFDAPRFEHALRSLGELAEDVLAVAGARRPVMEEVPLGQAVSSALLLARPAGNRVTVDAESDPLRVCAQRGPLVHALFNLLDNACRVTPPAGTVRVRLARGGDGRALVEIADQGPGMPPGVEGARGPVPSRTGAGLGLVAARRFLEPSGGRVSFAPGPEGGTVCRVSLIAAPLGLAKGPG